MEKIGKVLAKTNINQGSNGQSLSQNCESKQQWTAADDAEIAAALAIVAHGQKAYGKIADPKTTLAYYRFVLSEKFTAAQVVWALKKYVESNNDMPAPADINNILNPSISRAEYAAAVERARRREALNDQWDSDVYNIIAPYERQQAGNRAEIKKISKESKYLKELERQSGQKLIK